MKKCAVYGGRWELCFTDQQANLDIWEYWELPRVDSMAEHLWEGAILVDVGSEHGSMSAISATMVGPGNMVLIESSPFFWPEIRATWDCNEFEKPLACWAGLVGDHERDAPNADYVDAVVDGWPVCAGPGGEIEDPWAYRYIRDHSDSTPMSTLDRICENANIVPDAITMDIEGAELMALRGARGILQEHRPLVWVSVHPDLLGTHFGQTEVEFHQFMESVNYVGELIAIDHEQHWLFRSTA